MPISEEMRRNIEWHGFSPFWGKKTTSITMISLNDFRYASYEKKCDFVAHCSDYIAMRQLADCKVYLYHTGDFFIEVYYSPNHQQVLMLHAFTDTEGLEPYADGVSLTEIGC